MVLKRVQFNNGFPPSPIVGHDGEDMFMKFSVPIMDSVFVGTAEMKNDRNYYAHYEIYWNSDGRTFEVRLNNEHVCDLRGGITEDVQKYIDLMLKSDKVAI